MQQPFLFVTAQGKETRRRQRILQARFFIKKFLRILKKNVGNYIEKNSIMKPKKIILFFKRGELIVNILLKK
jgi:hypothetical protein